MESSDLRVFEAVARLGSITGASAELHTVQSNVTARIHALEDELGVALFRRHSRGVVLTSAGERLLPYAIKIAQLLKDAANVVGDKTTPRGRLQIGSLESTAGVRLPPILSAYRQKFPEVNLVLTTGTTGHLIEEVLARRLEGAFVAGPVERAEIVETRVFTEEMVLVTSPKFRSLNEAVRSPHGVNIHALPRDEALVPTMFIRRKDAVMSAALSRFLECALACASAAAIRTPPDRKAKRLAKLSKIA